MTQSAYCSCFNVRVGVNNKRSGCKFLTSQSSKTNFSGAGMLRSMHTDDNIKRIHKRIRKDRDTSTRRRLIQLGFPQESLQRISHFTVRMFSYKIQPVQELKLTDYQQPLDYAIYFRQNAEENYNFVYERQSSFLLAC